MAVQLGLPYNITLDDYKKPGYVDPIVSQANKWKADGLNDTQIVDKFAKQGVIYDLKTQDWFFGYMPTAEQEKIVPLLSQNRNISSNYSSQTINAQPLTSPPSEIDAGMWTNYQFDGFDYYMCPGTLTVSGQGTAYYYLTTHIGCGSGGCAEIGVNHTAWDSSHYWIYTYSQNDNPHWGFTNIQVEYNYGHEYSIYTNQDRDSNGYKYVAVFDGQVIRTMHMTSLNCQISQCLEAHDYPGCQYSDDTNPAQFWHQSLMDSGGAYVWWDSSIPDASGTPRHDYPTQLYRYIYGSSWDDEMWVQN